RGRRRLAPGGPTAPRFTENIFYNAGSVRLRAFAPSWSRSPLASVNIRGMIAAIDRAAIERVHGVIAPYIRRTPVVDIDSGDVGLAGRPITIKLELLQRAGSFKTRGAFANLLTRVVPPAGVVAASGGNHGAAVAFAA